MAVWSSFALKNIAKLNLGRSVPSFKNAPKAKVLNCVPARYSHERTIIIRDSEFLFKKMKDMFILYFLVGAIPLGGIILYSNIFIGPATLALIPEGYDPQPWEYHKHPITRFLAKLTPSQQENHERNLHCIFVTHEKLALQKLRSKIENLMKHRQDYQAWYFIKPEAKYVRKTSEIVEESLEKKSTSFGWIK